MPPTLPPGALGGGPLGIEEIIRQNSNRARESMEDEARSLGLERDLPASLTEEFRPGNDDLPGGHNVFSLPRPDAPSAPGTTPWNPQWKNGIPPQFDPRQRFAPGPIPPFGAG